MANPLDTLISALEVKFLHLTECLVGPGYGLQLGEVPAPGIHYNVQGRGKGFLKDGTAIALEPHTLVIVPPKTSFRIEVAERAHPRRAVRTVDSLSQLTGHGPIQRFVACEGEPEVVLICGFFHARYGVSTELFQSVRAPVVVTFSPADSVDTKLRDALNELVAQEVGAGAMSDALLKQVLVTLIRRSLENLTAWNEQFALLRDGQISRAFAAMAASPGAAHSIESLAKTAALSRSAFMERFAAAVGRPPMEILRDLRMKQAAQQVKRTDLSIEQIAQQTGYASRSSFVRAFRQAHGMDPRRFRDADS